MSFFSEIPETAGKYLKLKQGENRLRILGPSIAGSEGWTKVEGKKKPIRKKMGEAFATGEVDESTLKFFWAMPIWNYADNKVQAAEFTQKSIMKSLKKLADNKAWGEPTQYDIVITKEGEMMDTEYSLVPEPKSPLEETIKTAWEAVKPTFDLNRLFESGDPFTAGEGDIDISNIPF